MKIKQKTSKVTRLTTDCVEIFHSQSIKQNQNYQSAECSFGVKLTANNTPEGIEDGFKRAIKIVETHLAPKAVEHKKILAALG